MHISDADELFVDVDVFILAGGAGQRLWPLSRRKSPKFLIQLDDGWSLLSSTIRRALQVVPADRIHLVTTTDLAAVVAPQGRALGVASVILEPSPRDTAPCLYRVASWMQEANAGAVGVSLPADHFVDSPSGEWEETLSRAVDAARAGGIVCIGIPASSPSTEYGYMEAPGSGLSVRRVKRFHEKPDESTANALLAGGGQLWNTAIMAWRPAELQRITRLYAPSLSAGVDAAVRPNGEVDSRAWDELTRIAVDHAVLEPAAGGGFVSAIPATFGWKDLGTWSALAEHVTNDAATRLIGGTEGSVVVHAPGVTPRTYVVHGLDRLLVVDSGDVVLLANLTNVADLKRLVSELAARGDDHLL